MAWGEEEEGGLALGWLPLLWLSAVGVSAEHGNPGWMEEECMCGG